MAKAEWGLKRICLSCGARYYDMKKHPPTCPSCGTAFDPEAQVKTRRGRSAPKPAVVEAPPPVVEEAEGLPAAEGEEEEAVIEDAEELGEDVVEEVVEVGEA